MQYVETSGKQNLESKTGRNLGLRNPASSRKNHKNRRPSARHQIANSNSRYCQLLMLAKKGQILMLNAEKIACPAAKAALGLGPLPEKISSREMLCAIGLFSFKEAAA